MERWVTGGGGGLAGGAGGDGGDGGVAGGFIGEGGVEGGWKEAMKFTNPRAPPFGHEPPCR